MLKTTLAKHPLALYLTWSAILVILPLPLIALLNSQLTDSNANLVIFDAGIVAYVWWLAIVYLSTRPRWLDRLIGLPAMYFIHGMLGVLALVAAAAHQQFASSYHDEVRLTGHWAFYLVLFGMAYAVFFMSGWLVDRSPLARAAKARVTRFLRHELSVWVHRLNFVAIFLIWLHVHLIPRVASLTSFVVLFNVYTFVSLGTYAYYHFVGLADESKHGKLLKNVSLSEHIQHITIQLPEGAAVADYKAGDFYFLRFSGRGISGEPHPFSVASAPSETSRTVEFMIQSVGDFSSGVSSIPVDTDVILEGPFGRFAPLIEEHPHAPLVLYGLGSGIAPLRSIAREYAGSDRDVHVVWSAKNERDFALDDEFRALSDQSAGHLTYDGRPHRYTEKDLRSVLSPSEIQNALFFIVGSASVLLKVEDTLKNLGVDSSRIHDERLTM